MNNNYINLKQTPTAWVFLVAAANDVDEPERHLIDLAWGLKNITDSGVNHNDIFIYLDSALSQQNIETHLDLGILKFHAKSLNDYMSSNPDLFKDYKNVVFFVLGHGSSTGIDSVNKITPYQLINKIKGMPGSKNAILYLGQCYGGIFNYLKVGTEKKPEIKEVDLSIIGATEFQLTISYAMKGYLYDNSITTDWVANVFMYNLFKWFKNPVDMDGDSKFSILDSYKYTEIETSQYLNHLSSIRLHVMNDLYGKRSNIQSILEKNNLKKAKKDKLEMDIAAIESELNKHLALFSNKQEGWLLNANPARDIGL